MINIIAQAICLVIIFQIATKFQYTFDESLI